MTIDFTELYDRAKYFSDKGFEWHHHYLPPDCILNTTGEYVILLEAEGRQWQAVFDKNPKEELMKIDKLKNERRGAEE